MQSRIEAHPTRRSALLLGLCLALAGFVCIAQIRGSTILVSLLMAVFLVLTLLAVDWRRTMPLFLFFLPWSPLLKLYQGGISFFTVALLLACIVHFVRSGWRLRPYQIFCTAGIVVLTLLSKALHGHSLSMGYLFFVVMLVLFPTITDEETRNCSFLELTLFFALGIISAALIAQQIAAYPRIRQFVKVDSYLTITRLSGFYGDPNFYSAHITACIAGIQILLMREHRRVTRISLFVLVVVLIYCGLLSASKSFAVVLACQFLVWIPLLMEKRNRGSTRVRIVLGVLVAALILLSSSSVEDLLRVLDTRFSYAANISQITTGRTDLWMTYLREFGNNPLLLLLGEGYTTVTINGRASHNTILQGIYQLGLLGFPILLIWMFMLLRVFYRKTGSGSANRMEQILLLTGVMLPWLSLDILFFDEIFILPIYVAAGAIDREVTAVQLEQLEDIHPK